jgi:hypothetical protein
MRDTQKDFFEQQQTISKNMEKIAISLERLQIEQNARLDNHGGRLSTVEAMSKVNNEQRIISKAYWGIAGVVLTASLSISIKLLIFPS